VDVLRAGKIALSLFLLAAGLAAADLHRDAFVMDGHVHVMTRQLLQNLDIGQRYKDGHVDLPRAREGGIDAMFFSVYTPEAYYPARHELKNTLRVVELALAQIEKNRAVIELARTASDIERINRAGRWPLSWTSRAPLILTATSTCCEPFTAWGCARCN
jgi:membrane dipeptidase